MAAEKTRRDRIVFYIVVWTRFLLKQKRKVPFLEPAVNNKESLTSAEAGGDPAINLRRPSRWSSYEITLIIC